MEGETFRAEDDAVPFLLDGLRSLRACCHREFCRDWVLKDDKLVLWILFYRFVLWG